MLISIIIPSFRQPQFLGRAIESCLQQDYVHIEVIVVDDRSMDSSLGLALACAHNDPRVKVIHCEENGGLGKARNIGLTHASGDYLCFLDSDDYLLESSLSVRVDAIEGAVAEFGENVVGVYGDWQHVAEAVDYPTQRQPRAHMPVVSAETFTGENVFICSAPLVERQAVLAAGGFPEGLPMLEDFALWAKMIAAGAIFVPVRHVVSTYRQRPNSMLRGDGVVVMADHVEVINRWMADRSVRLADGGALSAWLNDQTPYSFGRMSWNVPSVLGSFGGAPGARSVRSSQAGNTEPAAVSRVDDFMSNSITSGLDTSLPACEATTLSGVHTAFIVASLEQSLQAVALCAELAPGTAGVFTEDPSDWGVVWPLPLAGYIVRSASELPMDDYDLVVVDLSAADDVHRSRHDLTERGVATIWPDPTTRSGSIVYVPNSLNGYPALDAWISTALHALADIGLEPRIVCDPAMASLLGGYRFEYFSIDACRSATVVVMASCTNQALVRHLVPTVMFDPSKPEGAHARTSYELREQLAQRTH